MSPNRRVPWALLVALVALGTCAPNGPGPGSPGPGGKAPPAPQASFTAGEVRAVDARDRSEASAAATEEAGKVIDLLNSYYSVAFVDPKRWGKGKHPELVGLFTDEARASVAPNLDGLALADLATALKAVSPSRQEATRVSFEIEENLGSLYAVATVAFEGTGTARAKKDGPVAIGHNAIFWLAKQADVWKIAAYQTRLKADTVSRGAAWPPSPRSPGGERST
ncbi:MAG: hypothetical protein ACRDJF_13310 [Actinomycetota bacterium]